MPRQLAESLGFKITALDDEGADRVTRWTGTSDISTQSFYHTT